MKTRLFTSFFLLLALWIINSAAAAETRTASPAIARSEFTPAAEKLAQLVEAFVVRDEIVGAELLVVHDGAPILHRAFGLADREAKRPLERDAYFAVRSMTKPFTGMAAQILIEDGKLELDAPVARYLASFDNDKSRAITIRHLLTHRAGFPFFHDSGKSLRDLVHGLRELADHAAERGPVHAPGERFGYSDVGSDVLGAVVARVAGKSLEDVVHERILVPLQLRDTFPETEALTEARKERVSARYLGVAGHWTRYWGTESPPVYPFLKGSGGLYSTTRDYARFLEAWMERGNAVKTLSSAAIARALAPVSRDALSTGLIDATTDYGQMWMLYRRLGESGDVFGFGHGGSDGTHAYAFPGNKLIVCYFTQTRGNETAARFEAALSHLFFQPNDAAMTRLLQPQRPERLAEFTGLYAPGNEAAKMGAVIELGGTLAFEIPGKMWLRLHATEEPDRWVPERAPKDAIVFRREEARVVGLALHRGGRVDEAQRFRPEPTLPTAEELSLLRMKAAPRAAVAALWPLRVSAELLTTGGKLLMTSSYDEDGRALTELDLGPAGKLRIWIAGERVWRQLPSAETVTELHGIERAEYRAGSLSVELGDWRQAYRDVTVLARETFKGQDVFRVRLAPREGLAVTKLISAASGVVLADYGITIAAGGGPQGTETVHSEFREVAGVHFAFAQHLRIPGIGANVETQIREITPRATVDRATLSPPQ